MVNALSLRRVAKRFPSGIQALGDVTLDAEDGELLAVLGGGGSGKTTLLRIVAGLEEPSAGEIVLFGERVRRGAGRRPVSLMFQSQALFPHLTVAENVAYGLQRGRRMSADVREMVTGLLVLVGLEHRATSPPATLAEGERRRLAFARSLARRPRILLLDAPTAGLDDRDRARMQTILRSVQRSTGITFILATDDPDEAVALADRIAVLDDGVVVEVGPPGELRERPASRAAARLVARMNLVQGRIETGGAHPVVHLQGFGPRVLEGIAAGARAVTVGIPPAAVRLTREYPRHAPAPAVAAFVRGLAFVGGRRCVLVESTEGVTLVAVAPDHPVREGDAVWLDLDDSRVVVIAS